MIPQLVPSHVAVPLGSPGQGVHEEPHEATLELLEQTLPQMW